MKPAGASLPEFDAGWGQHVPAPIGWFRDILAGVFGFELFPFSFKGFAAGKDDALAGSPGGDLAAAGTRLEIRFRFGFRNQNCSTAVKKLTIALQIRSAS